MTATLPWRLGLEVELLAPKGKSRRDLADAIAQARGGSVRRFFHAQSEPSKVPGKPTFHNLTQGFEVVDSEGQRLATCVDDLTLQADLARDTLPQPGWYRVISDDQRLLRLIQEQSDPEIPLQDLLIPIARLFGTEPQPGPGGMIKVNDRTGASIAIGALLPGERERPCELVTVPIESDHQEHIESLLSLARTEGFLIPHEGATHLHFDASQFQSAASLANLIQLLWCYGEPLKKLMGTNPNCVRLGPWPESLIELATNPAFRALSWPEAQRELAQLKLTKYCDFNILNCIQNKPNQNTIEVRILPTYLETQPILEAARVFISLLERALAPEAIPYTRPRSSSPGDCQELQMLLNTPIA